MKPHIIHPEAGEEYARAVEYDKGIAPELGDRFHDEIERLIHEVRRPPERVFRSSPPAQRALARKFPYSVVHLEPMDPMWIVAVMHAKRHPGYWCERLG